jgi:hypothetical protein
MLTQPNTILIHLLLVSVSLSIFPSSTTTLAQSTTTPKISLSQSILAASDTASNHPDCTPIRPFYFEIGNATHRSLTNGSLTNDTSSSSSAITSETFMKIASASKWIFGAYVYKFRIMSSQPLTDSDILHLTMRSGYTNFGYGSCEVLTRTRGTGSTTVSDCFNVRNVVKGGFNNDFDASTLNKFDYDGGHFQNLAAKPNSSGSGIDGLNLGSLTSAQLSAEINRVLNQGIPTTKDQTFDIRYDSPQLAGGAATTASDYAKFMQSLLSSPNFLKSNISACASPSKCPQEALYSPIPSTETWSYSLGHWIETASSSSSSDAYFSLDSGTLSSPGAFGFYPWIDNSHSWYGIIAREVTPTASSRNTGGDTVAFDSVQCGRAIRRAWLSGVGTTGGGSISTPTPTPNAAGSVGIRSSGRYEMMLGDVSIGFLERVVPFQLLLFFLICVVVR